MGEGLFEGAGEVEVGSFESDSEDGFAEAVDAVGGGFERLGSGIAGGASDNDLRRMMGEESGSQAVGGGEEAVLWGDSGEGLEGFLGEGAVAVVTCETVHANQRDGGDGIGAGRGGILEGFAANVEAAHRSGVRRTVEEAAAFGVTVAGDGEGHGLLRGGKIAGIERGFVGIEKSEDAEDLVVERAFESGTADAVAKAAGFGADIFQHAIEGLECEGAAVSGE